ncbi:unnamed protein product [marine sediment metagenome]|uniref:Uncharacterized protein n=1 Tax=marine sediment metagenome TaxID=412755 RepID=X1S0C3_9ZZZZ
MYVEIVRLTRVEKDTKPLRQIIGFKFIMFLPLKLRWETRENENGLTIEEK